MLLESIRLLDFTALIPWAVSQKGELESGLQNRRRLLSYGM